MTPSAALTLASLLGWLGGGALWPDAVPGVGAGATAGLDALDRAQRLRAVDRLAAQRESSSDAAARVDAMLLPVLQDPDATVRAAAARVLGRAGVPEALTAAVAWSRSPSPPERPLGLMVLRDAPTLSPDARAAVERCVRDAEIAVRLLALDVLGRHGATPSYAAVVTAIDDEQRDVRLRAIHLLEEARDRRATVPLLGRLSDSDRQVNLDAIHALGVLGDPGAVPALLRLVQTGSEDLRLAAIDALAELRPGAAAPVLVPLARRRPVDDLGRHALLALGQIASPPALAILIDRLREPPIPADVKEALRRAGPAAVAPLVALLRDPAIAAQVSTLGAAADVLGAVGDRRATAALVELVDRASPATPEALMALATLRDPHATAALVRTTEAPAPERRRLAFEALIAVGDQRGTAALARGLGDADPAVRLPALRLAARLRAQDAATAVLASVVDSDPEVRRQALVTLGALDAGAPDATTTLLGAARALDQRTAAQATATDLAEAQALGDALERAVAARDVATVEAALLPLQAAARGPVLRALLAAQRGAARALGPAVVARLWDWLGGDDALAETAADLLATMAWPAETARHQEARLLGAFDTAGTAVRARLAPALARAATPAARAHLLATLSDDTQPDDVRAAAAWAARDLPGDDVRALLVRTASGDRAAVAANARAALSRPPSGVSASATGAAWTGVHLQAPAGLGPLPRRWLILTAPGGPPIWALTGASGDVRVLGLSAAAAVVQVSDDDPALRLARAP